MDLHYELDHGFGAQGRLGLIVLSTDETLENEARRLLAGKPVSLLHSRIRSEPEVTPAALRMMEGRLGDSAALLPEGLDVVGYGCTSGAMVIGPDRVARLVGAAQPGARVTNPLSAAIAALRAVGARRIALLTPYVASVNTPLRAAFEAAGLDVVAEASFHQRDDRSVARIAERDVLTGIKSLGNTADCDAIFASCTNLRTLGILRDAEAATGRPVVSSNLALIWHMLRLAQVAACGWGPGRLFAEA